jgi:hypothetical protein
MVRVFHPEKSVRGTSISLPCAELISIEPDGDEVCVRVLWRAQRRSGLHRVESHAPRAVLLIQPKGSTDRVLGRTAYVILSLLLQHFLYSRFLFSFP